MKFIISLIFILSFCYADQDLMSEMQLMKKQLEQLQNQVKKQQSIIDNLTHGNGTFSQKKYNNISPSTYDNIIADLSKSQENTVDDLLDSRAESGFLRGNAFYLKAGMTYDPFDNGWGWVIGGVLDLKLVDFEHSSLLGSIGLSLARSKDRKNVVTSDVLGPLENQELRLSSLTIDLNFKYRLDNMWGKDSMLRRFQPYVRGGAALQVFISDSDSIIAGQVPQAQELEDSNVPTGQGNLYPALSVGGGFDFMLTRMLYLGVDYGGYFLFTDQGYGHQLAFTAGTRF